MIELSSLEEYSGVVPNHFVFTSVISAYAQAGEGHRAEEFLREMYDSYAKGNESIKPRVAAFTACIQAYSNESDAVSAVSRGEALVNEMWTRSRAGEVDVKPNGGTCSVMLDFYCKVGNIECLSKALALIEVMVNEYAAGDDALKPGERAFSAVLDALEASDCDEDVQRIERLQQRVQDISNEPQTLVN